MSPNRVIGRGGKIPWHLPEDFRWFKKCTTGQVILMGRKTFESLGRPLPNRHHVILSRNALEIPGVEVIHDLSAFDESRYAPREVWLIGGADLYRQLLPRCSDLYLTLLRTEVEGDTFLPPFEELFYLAGTVFETPDFVVQHWSRHPAHA
jgi:dihydrofolate reductase